MALGQVGSRVSEFFYKESKFNPIFFSFLGGGGSRGGVDGRTDVQTQTNLPIQLLRNWGIAMNKCTSYGPDKLNL